MKLHQEISQSFFISLDAIYANKMRAVLTTLGIIIGVVTVSLMNMAIDGVSNSFIRSISVLGSDTLYIEKNGWLDFQLEWWKRRGRRDITLRQSRKFMELMGNQFLISPYVSHQICTVEYNSEKISGVFMEGAIAESAVINNFEFSQGRFYDNNEVEGERPVCILGNDTVEALFKHESPIGKRVKINGINYEVIGTLKERGTFMGFSMDNVIYLPITRMLNDFARHPNVGISVQIKDLTQVDELTEEIRGAMRRVRQIPPGEPDDFAINKQEVLLNTFNRVSGVIASVGLFITALSLFVGGIGVMNIMFVSVSERTKEIGLRKAIGARRRTILLQFLSESILICLIGGCIGILIACSLSPIVNHYIPASISIKTMLFALVIAAFVGVISGYIPAWKAASMNPVDALRKE